MTIRRLTTQHTRSGRVVWIGLRPARRAAIRVVSSLEADPEQGLLGDHYTGRHDRRRQITLVQAEHLQAIEGILGQPVNPEMLRRNVVIAGLDLLALKGQPVRIGQAIILITGACHPCSRMEEALGNGGYDAMRGHGGFTGQILRAGAIAVGDGVVPLQGDLFAFAEN